MIKSALNHLIFILLLMTCRGVSTDCIQSAVAYSKIIEQNPADKKLLLNGRIWRNEYSKVIGDQFFLSNTFLKGSVIFNGRRFNNLDLKYDICNDELILSIESYPIIILNKEMVDSFNIIFENRNYHIINAGTDTSNVLRGYVNVVYNGPSTLYVKYTKKIQPQAVDGRYDLFYQEHHIYLTSDAKILSVFGKRKLLDLLQDKKQEIRYYLRSSRLKLMQKDPNTFIPVLKHYDNLRE